MRFRLTYRGPLRPRGQIKLPAIHEIRLSLHPQLKQLWDIDPLSQLNSDFRRIKFDTIEERAGMRFRPIVCGRLQLIAHLDVLFLRPQPPGAIIGVGGDIDNRLKTLLDALRIPSAQEINDGGLRASSGDDEIYCLLQDDALLTKVSFESDRLLGPHDPNDAFVVLHVTTGRSKAMAFNEILASF